jgi:hypothetical protein
MLAACGITLVVAAVLVSRLGCDIAARAVAPTVAAGLATAISVGAPVAQITAFGAFLLVALASGCFIGRILALAAEPHDAGRPSIATYQIAPDVPQSYAAARYGADLSAGPTGR